MRHASNPLLSLLDARILLVDDDPGAIQAMARLLAGYGQMRHSTGGAEALRMVSEWLPELILLDAEMPGLSGFDVLRALHAEPQLAQVPVIFVTQHGEAQVEAAALELGAADFLVKPVTGPTLLARVAMHLRLGRLLRMQAHEATQDALTGLANRHALQQQLVAEWARAQRDGRALTLLLADIDHFRAYNEARGPAAGDDCLRAFAHLLCSMAQRPGDLAARHGADGFALLLPSTDAAGAQALAQRLVHGLAAWNRAHPASVMTPRVTASVGLGIRRAGTHTSHPVQTATALWQQAQDALRTAQRTTPGGIAWGDQPPPGG